MPDLSTKRLPSVKSPPTSQYAPTNMMKSSVVIAGVVMNIIPMINKRSPQRRTSHQGRRLSHQHITSS
jgi:hypothetical protein